MEKTDEELIAEYLGGADEAFASLLKRYVKGVFSFVARSTLDDAEDIVQDIFLKAWKNLKKYDSKSAKFKTWLMRITRNTVIDAVRKKRPLVFSHFETDEGDAFTPEVADPEPLPEELIARAQDACDVQEILQKISLPHREVLLLHYMSHQSFEEIAVILGVSASTVRSRHRRGISMLRRQLEELHRK
jgi:RNA polymerase sigma-70 factor (ECF subfamily)